MKRCGALIVFALLAVSAWAGEVAESRSPRLVTLAPNLTELAFAAGAGEQIVATVEYSDYPAAARSIPRIGDAFRVDLERLLALRPDVVLAWQSGTPVQLIERMRALGLPVEIVATQRLADVAQAVRRIGELGGSHERAEQAARTFEDAIAELRGAYAEAPRVRVFLHINAQPLYTVNGRHIISEVAALCGGDNVFAALQELAPTVGIEAVIAANPDAIITTDENGPDTAHHWSRWQAMRAVRAGNVFTLSADELTRATPRLAQAAQAMCRALDTARENLRRTAVRSRTAR
jgi:iron complex transport system substrate-binding protein